MPESDTVVLWVRDAGSTIGDVADRAAVLYADGHSSTLLDPDESPEQPEGASALSKPPLAPKLEQGLGTCFLHSHWQGRRRKVLDVMRETGTSTKRYDRFRTCGESFWVLRSRDDPTRFKLARDFCHDRWCEVCGKLRAETIAANLLGLVGSARLRIVTLTLRHTGAALTEQIDRLYTCYKRLRRCRMWRERVSAAAAFFELTHNTETGEWHPHMHVLTQGGYLPWGDLRSEWLRATGDSHVVDVREVRQQNQILHYVTKYTCKPLAAKLYTQPELLAEVMQALRHRKLLILTGKWRAARVTRPPKNEEWTTLYHLYELANRAVAGSVDESLLLDYVYAHWADIIREGEFTYDLSKPP